MEDDIFNDPDFLYDRSKEMEQISPLETILYIDNLIFGSIRKL